jgi:hypothetical protein
MMASRTRASPPYFKSQHFSQRRDLLLDRKPKAGKGFFSSLHLHLRKEMTILSKSPYHPIISGGTAHQEIASWTTRSKQRNQILNFIQQIMDKSQKSFGTRINTENTEF